MKSIEVIEVDVYEVMHLRYDWTCPVCGSAQSLDVYSGDFTLPKLECKYINCRETIYRHGPRDYRRTRPE